MSENILPEKIKPYAMIANNAIIAGTVSLQAFERLGALLCSSEGSANASLKFYKDLLGHAKVQGELQATVQMTCQRCMEPLEIVFDVDIDLMIANSDEQAKEFEKYGESWVVSTKEAVPVVDLLEEELILALPIVAMHDDLNCAG